MITDTQGNTNVAAGKESTLDSSNVRQSFHPSPTAGFHPAPGPIGRVYYSEAGCKPGYGQYYLHTQRSGHMKVPAPVGHAVSLRQGAADRLVAALQRRQRPYQLATIALSVTTVILSVLLGVA